MERTIIPQQLQNSLFRFVKLGSFNSQQSEKNNWHCKAAFEKDWQTQNNYSFNDGSLLDHLKTGANYGVIGGYGGLIIIDGDCPEVAEDIKKLPKTFMVKSKKGAHYYFFCPELTENIKFKGPDPKTDYGQIQVKKKYVVGPNSIHPSGIKYQPNDLDIAWISKEDLFSALKDWLEYEETEDVFDPKYKSDYIDFPISNLLSYCSGFKKISDGYIGPHPIHGSTNGKNLHINTRENKFYCHRCGYGGGSLALLAILEGVIECGSKLRGDDFIRAKKIAIDKGYYTQPQTESNTTQKTDEEVEEENKVMEIADNILRDFTFVSRMDDSERTYIYLPDKGIYSDKKTKSFIFRCCREIEENISKHKSNEVLFNIMTRTYQPDSFFEENPYLVFMKNGIFNIMNMELIPFSSEYFSVSQIPVKYDPNAKCPLFLKFLSEILTDEDIPIIQELFGYVLLRDYRFQKAFMFVGSGSNGKSTLMDVLERLLGKENISDRPLHSLVSNRFAIASLYGKMINMFADISSKELEETGAFKALTGGDSITAEFKYLNSFEFTNYAKLIFSCNTVPKTSDDSVAFYRRWIIIKFLKHFTEETKDPNKINEITTPEELSGIFNWAIEGLKRLLKNNKFSYKKDNDQIKIEYTRLSNPLKAFIEECIESDCSNEIPKDDFYVVYCEYCRKYQLMNKNKKTIGRNINKYVNVTTTRPYIDGSRGWCWKGIKFIDGLDLKLYNG